MINELHSAGADPRRVGSVRRSRAIRAAVSVFALLVIGLVVAVQTVPEFILYRERLVFNLLEIESNIDLLPVDLKTHDGLTLRSWYHPPAEGKPLIVYFPGRLEDLIRRPAHLFELAEEGYGLVLAGYRGYGGNPGRPSERLLYRDAASLLSKLTHEGYAPDGMVLYGYSMGTGIASHVATETKPSALILEAPFTSFPDAVRQQARSVPIWLVRSRFDTRSRITSIDVPILLLAGEQDRITPPKFAKSLAALSQGVSKLEILPEANHVNMARRGALEAVSGFLGSLGNHFELEHAVMPSEVPQLPEVIEN